jgi:hypothetical protein
MLTILKLVLGPDRIELFSNYPCRINVLYFRVCQRICCEILVLFLQIEEDLYVIWFYSYVVCNKYIIWQLFLKGQCECSSL